MDDASIPTIEFNNPTCGDVLQLQLVNDNGVIDVHFDGHGCTLAWQCQHDE